MKQIRLYSAEDLMTAGICGGKIDKDRALATYADPRNWIQIYQNGKCEWAFIGPTRPGYELARLAQIEMVRK